MFQKAERRHAKLKIALAGPSGSGKTMSALRMATAIGQRIAVIDTENGSASLYADKFDFSCVNLTPPFTADKYVTAINAAEQAGFDVIIVDSFSHAWAGEGGTLDQKGARDARGGSSFANWRDPKAEYAKVKNAILHSTSHMIVTVRSKQAYLQVADDSGKGKIQRVGMDPIAEPGIEYEFTVMFEVDIEHKASATKDRTSLFQKTIFQITEDTGAMLMKWLASAKPAVQGNPVAPAPAPAPKPVPTPAAASFDQTDVPMSWPASDARPDETPTCCGKSMMVSKYPDKNFDSPPWYCMTCKSKKPRTVAA